MSEQVSVGFAENGTEIFSETIDRIEHLFNKDTGHCSICDLHLPPRVVIEATEAALDELKPLTLDCSCVTCAYSKENGGVIDATHVWTDVYSKSDYEATVGDDITEQEWNQFKESLRQQVILVHQAYKIW